MCSGPHAAGTSATLQCGSPLVPVVQMRSCSVTKSNSIGTAASPPYEIGIESIVSLRHIVRAGARTRYAVFAHPRLHDGCASGRGSGSTNKIFSLLLVSSGCPSCRWRRIGKHRPLKSLDSGVACAKPQRSTCNPNIGSLSFWMCDADFTRPIILASLMDSGKMKSQLEGPCCPPVE